MNDFTITCNSVLNDFQILNPNSIPKSKDLEMSLELLYFLRKILHKDMKCSAIDGKEPVLTGSEISEILHIKNNQIVRIAKEQHNFIERNLIDPLFKNNIKKINNLYKSIENFQNEVGGILAIPKELRSIILSNLSRRSFIYLKSTSHYFKNFLENENRDRCNRIERQKKAQYTAHREQLKTELIMYRSDADVCFIQ